MMGTQVGRWLVRVSLVVLGTVVLRSALADEPVRPTLTPSQVSLAAQPGRTLGQAVAEVTRQTGVPVDLTHAARDRPFPAALSQVPFWSALDQAATATGHRVSVTHQGIALVPLTDGTPPPASCVAGPFRVAARQGFSRIDYETGRRSCDLQLDVAWEPGVHLFLIGLHGPSLRAEGAAGQALKVEDAAGGRLPARGSPAALTVRLEGIPRATASVRALHGELVVVAARRFLDLTFDAGRAPVSESRDGVEVTLAKFARPKQGSVWTVELRLKYPADTPEFESFQSWLADNRITLVNRTTRAAFEVTDPPEVDSGRPGEAVVRYLLTEGKGGLSIKDPAEWQVRYRTPGRIVEVTLPFTLTDIPLP
jgi:hypothetical protein